MKYGNIPSSCGAGHSHRSKLEAAVCGLLHLMMKAKEIETIQAEDHVYLSKARIGYVVDFKCTKPAGEVFYVEAKGFANDIWPLKKKLWKYYGPGVLHIYKGTYQKPYLAEVITPLPTLFLGDD